MHTQPQAIQPSQPVQQQTDCPLYAKPASEADAVPAYVQMIFASRSSGLPVHFKRLYDKKVSLLGLTALMGLPERQVPPGLAQNWQQVTLGILQLLVNYREQQVRRPGARQGLAQSTDLLVETGALQSFLGSDPLMLRDVAQHQGCP